METNCVMCGADLIDEEERAVSFCSACELAMMTELLKSQEDGQNLEPN